MANFKMPSVVMPRIVMLSVVTPYDELHSYPNDTDFLRLLETDLIQLALKPLLKKF